MTELNYHHLRYFQTVAHEGNLTRAAAQLNVSQSAISTQIRQLEERLGQALFERRGRALYLTEAGRIALDHADSIFATGRELIATLQQSGEQRQALRVGSLATLSRNFQLAFLRPVLGRPDVEVILRSGSAGELFSALSALHLDLVLTNQPPPADALTSFVVQRLDEQTLSLIGVPELCPPDLTLPERFSRSALILPTAASGLRMGFDALVDRLGVRPQIVAEVDDMAMMRLLAREGIGLAVMPPIVVRDELASGALVESAQLSNLTETFYGVTVERRFPNPLLAELMKERH
ncbi:LysR family transcriptional regulator [Denitrobaculum tricleocarpae]|uniref:LysR family transcriptional regulator n=1 Tax=Denitrobaculum tricleocarpae TaxID=2591009 RepID=A0A545U133_9PROT|nr:LysR family transcriptional regulator [Denitrobaculum tricleocarpae]TQV83189.1 LysR family transcriptional regulator [Denitrobaculum tricleocarpae]